MIYEMKMRFAYHNKWMPYHEEELINYVKRMIANGYSSSKVALFEALRLDNGSLDDTDDMFGHNDLPHFYVEAGDWHSELTVCLVNSRHTEVNGLHFINRERIPIDSFKSDEDMALYSVKWLLNYVQEHYPDAQILSNGETL